MKLKRTKTYRAAEWHLFTGRATATEGMDTLLWTARTRAAATAAFAATITVIGRIPLVVREFGRRRDFAVALSKVFGSCWTGGWNRARRELRQIVNISRETI